MDDAEKELLAAFRQLGGEDRHALLAFAGFLAVRGSPGVRAGAAAPPPEPRPESETVVMAIRRLTRTYPMLDRRKLMGPTSVLVSQHVLQGRVAKDVIDELEVVFERHHEETVRSAK